jgi:hypothetical protein
VAEENDRYRLRSLVEVSIPRGRPWLLNEEQYQILHLGDPRDLKAWMFLCIGLLGGALEGILSTLQNVDWATAWAKHLVMPFAHLLIQIFVAACALAGLVICAAMLRRGKSLCADLKTRITQHFSSLPANPADEPKPSEAAAPGQPADETVIQKS